MQPSRRLRHVTSRRWDPHRKLLTDEDLRIRFALDRFETVAELCLLGAELTPDEIDLFCRTDALLWFVGDRVRTEWQLWTGTRVAECPDCPTLDPARSEGATVARVMDELIAVLARRETRRQKQ